MPSYLIVDDNEAFADNLAEILRDAGHTVAIAESGAAGTDGLRGHRYDALLTDMRMPGMSGAQFVRVARQMDPGLPVIAITAYSGADDLDTARREGLLAVLPKPVDVPQLLGLLGKARRDGLLALVEDDLGFADNLTEALREQGFTTVRAASVLETEHLAGIRPFAGIADLRVPGGPDGEAMRRLASRFPGIPLIVVTGHDLPPPRGVRRIFRKPLRLSDLLADVEEVFAARLRR